MLDFSKLEQYMENNRIEAKQAIGGLPHSIWETYSAFANTMGGYILLGVEERADKSFGAMDLPNPEALIREFWDIVNNKRRVSANIMSSGDIFTQKIFGKHIVVIYVPRAERTLRPIYLEGDVRNCYVRNGEGDYKCSAEDCALMLRDAMRLSGDMSDISEMDISVLDTDSVNRYRRRMTEVSRQDAFDNLNYKEFLGEIGAAKVNASGKLCPTAAGLLMFGKASDISKIYPDYRLDYQDSDTGERVVTSSDNWSGNVFDFYICCTRNISTFCKRKGLSESVQKALNEALINSLVNADYQGKRGVQFLVKDSVIMVSNPGNSRVGVKRAISGGTSDPRNVLLKRMFSLMDAGKSAGSGIPGIFRVWQEQGYAAPVITENYGPERFTLSLSLSALAPADLHPALSSDKNRLRIELQRSAIIEYLTVTPEGKVFDFERLLGVKGSKLTALLDEMVKASLLETDNSGKDKTYHLRRKSGTS